MAMAFNLKFKYDLFMSWTEQLDKCRVAENGQKSEMHVASNANIEQWLSTIQANLMIK